MPELITAHDERERCCVLDDQGGRCPNPSAFWVGTRESWDDYTYSCGSHLADVRRPGDAVVSLRGVKGMKDTVEIRDRLTIFLGNLVEDLVPTGTVEALVARAERASERGLKRRNPLIVAQAEEWAERLTSPPEPPEEIGSDEPAMPKHCCQEQPADPRDGTDAPEDDNPGLYIGDVVRLKSGGPTMTVVNHVPAGDRAECLYFRDGAPTVLVVSPAALVPAEG